MQSINEVVYERVPELGVGGRSLFQVEDLPELKNYFVNVAADAALHEDLAKLFPEGTIEKVDEILFILEKAAGNTGAVKGAAVTVESLRKELGVELEGQQDWLYYAKRLITWYAESLRDNDEELMALIEQGVFRRLKRSPLDQHDWDHGGSHRVQEALAKAGLEAKRLETCRKDKTLQPVGTESGEEQGLYQARKDLNLRIKARLQEVSQFLRRWQMPGWGERSSYHRPHLFMKGLPHRAQVQMVREQGAGVMVLDTSGSMWVPEFMEAMLGMVRVLQHKGQLRALYCCDVTLRPMNLRASGMVRVEGGGGTVWTTQHHTKILDDLGLKEGVRILYVTDEMVWGLKEAKEDPRVELSVLHLPSLL